VSTEPKMTRKV